MVKKIDFQSKRHKFNKPSICHNTSSHWSLGLFSSHHSPLAIKSSILKKKKNNNMNITVGKI